jgi:hypothetical protein
VRALALVALCSGCVTISTLQPASTMGKGNLQGGVDTTLGATLVPDPNLRSANQGAASPLLSVNGFFRFGVTDNVDLGIRGGGTLLEVQSKFMFTDAQSQFVLSLAPSVTGAYLPATKGNASRGTAATPEVGELVVPVPLLFGIKLGDHELVFSGRFVSQLVFVKPVTAPEILVTGYVASLGVSAGIALRLSNSFILVPEIAFQAPIAVTYSSSVGSGSLSGPGIYTLTAGVGCIFGRMKPRGPVAPPPRKDEEEQWEETAPPAPVVPSPPEALPPDVAPPPPPPPP